MRKLGIGDSETFRVNANDFWNESGIYIEHGARYELFVTPTEQTWSDGRLFPQVCTAEGFSNWFLAPFVFLKRHRPSKWFCLIGCINKQKGSFFEIGEGKTYLARGSGELVCFANDAPNHYKNNNGSLVLKITRLNNVVQNNFTK